MTLYRWNSRNELAEAQKQFSTLFKEVLRQDPRPHHALENWTPPVDVCETAEGYEFAIELPGMHPEAVEVEVKENTLTVKGERKDADLKEGERYLHRERPTGRFARVFRMSKPVNADGVKATYRDGILAVNVPLQVKAKPCRIQVQG